MNIEQIQQQLMNTYLSNMNFLKGYAPELHKKLEVLELGLNEGLIQSNFELEFKDNEYFDILDIKNNTFLYGENSKKYSLDRVNNIPLDLTKDSFKTFREFHYEEGVLDKVKNATITSPSPFGNAPIVDYVNHNTPEERVAKQIYCFMIFGTGLGYHLPLIDQKIHAKLYSIVEPNLEIFRLSLFITSYEELSRKAKLLFLVSLNKDEFASNFNSYHQKIYMYNHYIKFFYFSKSCEVYFEIIQSLLVSQSHTMFSYDRELLSLVKTAAFHQKEYNFIKISERFKYEFANNVPVLLLAGGPSLKKNIEFVKKNQNKFLIVSLYSLSRFLEENGIYPDIITNYDEQYELYLEIYEKMKDKSYFQNKVFLFGSHVSDKLVNLLPKENIYFFNALYSFKKNFGTLTAPSIGEMSYTLSLVFAPQKMYLLGLDLAFDQDTGKSHFDGYEEKAQIKADKEATLEKFSFRKNVIQVKGNFRETIDTLPIFKVSIRRLDQFTKVYNGDQKVKVFNLSDGAYFQNVEPLKIDTLNMDDFKELDKTTLHYAIKESVDKIASNKLKKEDLEWNQVKLDDAKKLKAYIQDVLSYKHSNSDNFLSVLERINTNLFNQTYQCTDLNTIIDNYFMHNLPHIFYLFSLRGLSNPKAHIKKISKRLNTQLNKIIDLYINLHEHNLKHFGNK